MTEERSSEPYTGEIGDWRDTLYGARVLGSVADITCGGSLQDMRHAYVFWSDTGRWICAACDHVYSRVGTPPIASIKAWSRPAGSLIPHRGVDFSSASTWEKQDTQMVPAWDVSAEANERRLAGEPVSLVPWDHVIKGTAVAPRSIRMAGGRHVARPTLRPRSPWRRFRRTCYDTWSTFIGAFGL